jgi:hypothetical protein
MTICVGDVVLYYQGDNEAPSGYDRVLWQGTNGTRLHPAIVTRVWSDTNINLQIMFDATAPAGRQGVAYLADVEFAMGNHCSLSGWRYRSEPEPSA